VTNWGKFLEAHVATSATKPPQMKANVIQRLTQFIMGKEKFIVNDPSFFELRFSSSILLVFRMTKSHEAMKMKKSALRVSSIPLVVYPGNSNNPSNIQIHTTGSTTSNAFLMSANVFNRT